MGSKLVVGLLALLLAACSGTSQDATATPGRGTPVPTPETAEYTEPAQPITLENASQIAELGRLDAPGQPSSIFRHDTSPDGTRLVALNNTLVMAWDLLTGELVFSTARNDVSWVYYSSDKTEIYGVESTGTVHVFDAESGAIQNSFTGHPDFSGILDFYSDDGLLVMGGLDGTFKVWDTFERQSQVTIEAHTNRVTALRFSPDGAQVASGGADSDLHIWDWAARESLMTFNHDGANINRLAFSPDGSRIASGTDTTLNVWSLESGEQVYSLQTGEGGTTDILTYSPDGEFILSGGLPPNAILWDAESGSMVTQLPDVGGNRLQAAFSSDGKLLVTTVLEGPAVLWNVAEARAGALGRANVNFGARNMLGVRWTDDSYTLALFDALGPVYIWGIPAG